MTEGQANNPHAPGTTTGSWERAPQELAGRALAFDLAVEAAQLRTELSYQEGDRNANTLVKAPDFRIVLTALRRGARLQEHQAAGRVSIQTVSGRLRLRLPDQTLELPAGHLLALEAGITHDVEALEDSVFLLTVAWPPTR
ncbi:MAG TPA: cupin domain-containing protein [Chloroflexota bacterium]|nr:cupin domain-containing protein [Chloroflexota bacterium]